MVARANGRHVGAQLGDDPRTLVTERAWQQGRHETVAHRQVGMAHAAGRQLHYDLVAADRPQLQLFHRGGPPGLTQHYCSHGNSPGVGVIPTYDGGTTGPGQGAP